MLNQSGESRRIGCVSLCGDEMMRAFLYEAAQVMITCVKKWSSLKAWAMNVAKRRGLKKAIVALAPRLAVVMHRIWSTAPCSAGQTRPKRWWQRNPKLDHHTINKETAPECEFCR